MNTKRTVGILLSTAAFLYAPSVAAEDDKAAAKEAKPVYASEIEIGVGWASEGSFKFGEYSGIKDKGAFVVGSFSVLRRDPWDGGTAEYWKITGTDLGLTSRSLGFEYGKAGKFSVRAKYDQIPKYLYDDARTPYDLRDGGTDLALPGGWLPSDRNATLLPNLTANLQDVNISHDRRKFGGGFTWMVNKAWTIKSDFYRELKEGSRTIAATFGSSGGNPAGAVVPEPVDYETDNFDLSLSYAGKKSQFVLNYTLSLFRDNLTSLTFDNPFDSTRYSADVNYPNGEGRIGLPPDNKAHRISFSGAHRFSNRTRVTAHFALGRMQQNDTFLPYTVNPALLVPVALPRSSLNGKIKSTLAKIAVSSRVTPKFNLRASYKYNNRDNETPRDVYQYVPGDTTDQDAIEDGRINMPYSRKQHLLDAEAGYRVSSDLRLTVGYDYEQLERTFSEVAKTKEHRFKAKLRSNFSGNLSGWIGIERGSRNGSEYDHNLPFIVSHAPEHFAGDPDDEFENHPLVRKFFIADRDRLKINGSASLMAGEKMSFSVFGRYSKDDYDKSQLGITASKTYSLTLDTSYNPHDKVSYHAFYTFESMDYQQTGYAYRPSNALDEFDERSWTLGNRDKVNTFGFGFDWTAIDDKVSVIFDYTYSNAVTDFDIAAGTAVEFEPLPNLKTQLHMANLKTDYQYADDLWLRFRYMYQKFVVTDFALDGVHPDSMAYIIGLGNQSPDYTVHVIGVSTIYRF